jgi:acyl dehydratase
MPLDPEKLLNYPIPEVTQTYTKRDTVFYALSIGLGQDPLDERQLDFVDHHRKLKVFPSMPVVLAHPGFWLAWPDTGVDAVKVVHGEQGIRWLKPLPPEGVVRGKTRITGLIDKGRDKGALLYSEKHLFDERGETLAILSSTTFLRGDGGFGGPSGPVKPVHPIPERPPELVLDLPTRPEQALYYRLNGDENPLHADPEVARRAGFPRPILHGLCTLGVVTHALLRLLCDYDPEGLASLELRFSAPVYPGETIRTEIWPREGAFRARAVERDVVVINHGKVVLKA